MFFMRRYYKQQEAFYYVTFGEQMDRFIVQIDFTYGVSLEYYIYIYYIFIYQNVGRTVEMSDFHLLFFYF